MVGEGEAGSGKGGVDCVAVEGAGWSERDEFGALREGGMGVCV